MNETVFTDGAHQLKVGPGSADVIGFDLAQLGARRVLVVTDPGDAARALVARQRRGVGRCVGGAVVGSCGQAWRG